MTESTASATERVGRYQLLEPIGAGPTGAVWRAKVFGVAGFERQFAVKRFLPDVTATPAAAQALSAGARAYGSLEHPRIARMTEFGVAQGTTFTAVELVAGLDAMRLAAEAKLAGVGLPAGGALALVSQVARAIGYAHGRGISHLGLSPTNVIVTADGDVKVTDFAILAATLPPKPADAPRLAGRIAYLAPEQLAAEATSAATDVFALGVLAYELVTGQRTFRGETPQQVAQAIMAGPPAEPALPRPIVRVLQRCLARSPFERFPDARAFADALDAALRVAPVPGSRKDIGAQVKLTLERLAELRENQMSGVLALNIGTGPVARLDLDEVATLGRDSSRDASRSSEPETSQYVRPDIEVPGPAPLRAPTRDSASFDTAATVPDLQRPMTTMPGVMPPPIPAPRSIPAIPPFRRPGSADGEGEPASTRVGARIQTDVAGVPSLATGRQPIPTIPAPLSAAPVSSPALGDHPAPPFGGAAAVGAAHLGAHPAPPFGGAAAAGAAHLGGHTAPSFGGAAAAGAAHLVDHSVKLGAPGPRPPTDEVSALAAELAALGDDLPVLDDASEPEIEVVPGRPRAIIDVRTEPGVGIRPTTPHLAAPPPIPARAITREREKTEELSPFLADKLGAASTKPTSEIPPLVADAYHADALNEFPDEVYSSSIDSATVAAAPSVSQRLVAAAAPSGAFGPNPSAPLRLPSTPPAVRARPRRWPWLVVGVLTLGVIGGVSYVGLSTLADDSDVPTARPAHPDARLVAVAGDATAITVAADAKTVAADAKAAVAATPDAGSAGAAVVTTSAGVVSDAAVAAVMDAAVAPDARPVPADAAATVAVAPGDALAISSVPSGAQIFVDNVAQGVTPAKLPGVAGRHTAVLVLSGFDLYVGELDGRGAFAIPLKEVIPSTGPAGIKVLRCAPNRYYVYVDGKPTGQLCPTERIGCDVGAHTVEVYDLVTGTRRKWDIQVLDTRLSFRVRVE